MTAVVVEDGTGKANADSYISEADAISYLALRGNTTFAAASAANQAAALRNATDFMVAAYRYRWAGYRFGLTQNLDWPRSYVPITDVAFGYGPAPSFLPFDAVPIPVQQTCADLAVRALVGPLLPDIARIKRAVTVGPIKVDYDPYASAVTVFAAVANKIAPYLIGQGSGRVQAIRT